LKTLVNLCTVVLEVKIRELLSSLTCYSVLQYAGMSLTANISHASQVLS